MRPARWWLRRPAAASAGSWGVGPMAHRQVLDHRAAPQLPTAPPSVPLTTDISGQHGQAPARASTHEVPGQRTYPQRDRPVGDSGFLFFQADDAGSTPVVRSTRRCWGLRPTRRRAEGPCTAGSGCRSVSVRSQPSGSNRGISTVNSQPSPGAVRSVMFPPCASAIVWAIARPRPEPPFVRERDETGR